MSVNTHTPAYRMPPPVSNPVPDWLRFRMMALEPIGDIADTSLTDNAAGISGDTLTWETATDWDNAVSSSGVAHESVTNTDHGDNTTILMGYSYNSPLNTDIFAYWPCHEDSGTTINDVVNNNDSTLQAGQINQTGVLNSTGIDFDGSDDWVSNPSFTDTSSDWSVTCWFKPESTGSDDRLISIRGDVQVIPMAIGRASSGQIGFWDNGTDVAFGSVSTETWYMATLTYDDTNTEFKAYLDASNNATRDSSTASPNGDNVWGTDSKNKGTAALYDGHMAEVRYYNRVLSSSEIQTLFDVVDKESTLTTATKSFSSTTKPDLQNLVYSLNSQSITLDVIGSPGTASEETVSQSLDGTSSFDLTWSNAHTDFRLTPRLSTTDPTTTPTFGKGELVAP